jgi:hypothetical protein
MGTWQVHLMVLVSLAGQVERQGERVLVAVHELVDGVCVRVQEPQPLQHIRMHVPEPT